jgi:hypothetical protein
MLLPRTSGRAGLRQFVIASEIVSARDRQPPLVGDGRDEKKHAAGYPEE